MCSYIYIIQTHRLWIRNKCWFDNKSMALCKTALSPWLTQRRYCSLALSHRNRVCPLVRNSFRRHTEVINIQFKTVMECMDCLYAGWLDLIFSLFPFSGEYSVEWQDQIWLTSHQETSNLLKIIFGFLISLKYITCIYIIYIHITVFFVRLTKAL